MYTSDELTKMVNEAIEAIAYERRPKSLYAPMKYVLSLGGKRIRPVLMLMAADMYGLDPKSIMNQAVAIETYHNYTLLHDDLMDNADMRRGHATVHNKWDANTAILSGDAMLVMAYKIMASCDNPKLRDVIDLFTETALEIGEGQQYDMDFENRMDVGEEEYIEMIRLKTSVLLACSLKIGAILAGAPSRDQDCLYKFGELIGLAFQLQDDLLDVYGDPSVFGKNIGGDITSNKKTYLLINALGKADGNRRSVLEHWLGLKEFDREEKIRVVRGLYDELGIREMCSAKIEGYFSESRRQLELLSIPSDSKNSLKSFTSKLMNRTY